MKLNYNNLRNKRSGQFDKCFGTEKKTDYKACLITKWSGKQDLNLQPHGPKPCALPSCATSR